MGRSTEQPMPDPIATLTTARLVAEPVAQSHFPENYRLHTDPKVMKTLSADGKPLTEKATREHIRQSAGHWGQHGFGLWVFRRRTDGQFIGRGGLKIYQIEGNDVIGLAYALLSDFWNRGFATEMGQVSLEIGFGRLLDLPHALKNATMLLKAFCRFRPPAAARSRACSAFA